MADEPTRLGSIGWIDLTVDDAGQLRDFYTSVVGWQSDPLDMGDYEDFVMRDPAGDARAGVCHRRGPNADQPPVWMAYFIVEDLESAAARCAELGGKILVGPKGDPGRYCVIEDPAGAICAIYEEPD